MKITPEQVAKVAKLARLKLPEDKLSLFAGQLHDILSYMDTLNEIDTSAVEPMYSPVAHVTVTRPDAVVREHSREEILANAPESDGQFFVVPRIV
jgi:aspartyl-tRNA(Asn)/glutamyl-tRNA(Gln) amidotransferase subunit C